MLFCDVVVDFGWCVVRLYCGVRIDVYYLRLLVITVGVGICLLCLFFFALYIYGTA